MTPAELNEASRAFHREAWLAALNGFCANPQYLSSTVEELARMSENVAHEAEQLFRNMNQDLPQA
jgi:hypothetical protein